MNIELDYVVTAQPETTAVYYRGTIDKIPDGLLSLFMNEYANGNYPRTAFKIIIKETGYSFYGRGMTNQEHEMMLGYITKHTDSTINEILNNN